MKLVIVESPAKAKTINRYLGDDYTVLASYGHVCDLPSKDGSVDPDANFAMKWQVSNGSEKRLNDITRALRGADRLILATDPDREGEAISWHVLELLQDRGLIKDKPVERVVFNEVTSSAILAAMEQPRQLDMELIDAYRARRALDYLVGFSISPVLWRKLPGARSAAAYSLLRCGWSASAKQRLKLLLLRILDSRSRARQGRWPDFTARLTHLDSKNLPNTICPTRRWPLPHGQDRAERCALPISRPNASARIRNRLSPPLPCSRKRHASSAFQPAEPCRWHRSYMRE